MKAIKESLNKNRRSYRFALKGIREASKGNNFRYQLLAAVLVTLAGFLTDLKPWEWIVVVIMIGLVLSAEAINTAIETLVDLVSPEQNPVAGKIKDLAAGAVLILAITSVVVALILFIPKLYHL